VKTPSKQVEALFFILTYQQEQFIEECLRSALAQDYQNLSILVSDDASTDRTPEIVQDILADYRGPHRTRFIRQPRNLRIHHINALKPEFQKQKFTVMGHGDDVFHPDRVSRSIATMVAEKSFSVTCNAVVVDEHGVGEDLLFDPEGTFDLSMETMCRHGTNRACFGAGMAWHRRVFGQFGLLHPGPRQVDQIIIFRSMLLGGASMISDPLMRYRQHSANLNMTRMAELASEADKILIEERRRNNVVATALVQRELLAIARRRQIGDWDYDALDALVTESILEKTRKWVRYRAKMADEGIGIY